MKNPEAERARCRAQYQKHAAKRRQSRRERYYANISEEREKSRLRMRGIVPRRSRPKSKLDLLVKLDRRWAVWARGLGLDKPFGVGV